MHLGVSAQHLCDSPTSDNLQHTPGLELSISSLDSTSNNDLPTSNNSQHAQQNAPGSISTSDNLQHAPGLELSISTLDHISNNGSLTSDNSQHALQNAPGSISTLDSAVISSSDISDTAQSTQPPSPEFSISHSQAQLGITQLAQ